MATKANIPRGTPASKSSKNSKKASKRSKTGSKSKKKKKKASKKSPYPIIKPHKHFGRPRKYKREFCDDIVVHMSEGGSFQAFTAFLGKKYGVKKAPGLTALKAYLEQYPDFQAAREYAEAMGRDFYDKVGNRGMVGQLKRVSKEEFEYDDNGKPRVKSREYVPTSFSSRTWNVMMKNRFGFRDRVEHLGSISTTKPKGDAIKKIFENPKLLAAATKIAELVAGEEDEQKDEE